MVLLALLLAAEPGPLRRYDHTYATAGGERQMLDLLTPPGPGPFPVVVCLHGGAWKAGSRRDLSRPPVVLDAGMFGALPRADPGPGLLLFGNREPGGSLLDRLTARGYAAVSVGYRLAPRHKFPAPMQDVTTALKYLRANAAAFRLDPERVGVMGFSAGGHLGSLLATAGDRVPEFVAGPPGDLRVAAVVNFFGPADLPLYEETPGVEATTLKPLFGGDPKTRHDRYVQASPVTHVTASAPPFLHLHGTTDVIVPIVHTERLHARLTAAGVPSELVVMRGYGHGWLRQPLDDSLDRAYRFLDRHVKGAK